MKPQCGLLKSHRGFNFMRRLNNFFPAHIGFIASNGEKNCDEMLEQIMKEVAEDARESSKKATILQHENRKVMLSFVFSMRISIFAPKY